MGSDPACDIYRVIILSKLFTPRLLLLLSSTSWYRSKGSNAVLSLICRRLSCTSGVFVSVIIVLVACPNVILSTPLYLHFIHIYLHNDMT